MVVAAAAGMAIDCVDLGTLHATADALPKVLQQLVLAPACAKRSSAEDECMRGRLDNRVRGKRTHHVRAASAGKGVSPRRPSACTTPSRHATSAARSSAARGMRGG